MATHTPPSKKPDAHDALRRQAATLTTRPGVYRFFDARGALLYVGKARNLRRRVASYFSKVPASTRIAQMVDRVRRLEVTVTDGEDAALVLEAELIKREAPRYNVLYRDDKSYPYLQITAHADYPRITFYRGPRKPPHRYFGPFPSAAAVRETLVSLQKLFRLRPCTDSFMSNRSRPCLQHQIGRCSAPCMQFITPGVYAQDVERATALLHGRGPELARELGRDMQGASHAQDFERAARLRDQIAALRRLQSGTDRVRGLRQADVLGVHFSGSGCCVTVVSVRDGRHLGHRSYFPRPGAADGVAAVLESFIPQYYLDREPPAELLLEILPGEHPWLEQWLSRRASRKVRIRVPQRGAARRLVQQAVQTAEQGYAGRQAASADAQARVVALAKLLSLEDAPRRMECFDISHTSGQQTSASCVVFADGVPRKSEYRRFNIDGLTPGDDVAAIHQAVQRRFRRIGRGEAPVPDLLLIDGGSTQWQAAAEALEELALSGVHIIAVSKGVGRRPGLETLHLGGRRPALRPPADSPALHLVQHLRDEAHRFALSGHRGQRGRRSRASILDGIEGLGPVRRRRLLTAFGGLQQLRRASVEDLRRIHGISRALAERVFAQFHSG